MKIMIIGSMKFVHQMHEIKKELEKLGHEATIPFGSDPHLTDGNFVDSLEENLKYCIDNDVMKKNFEIVANNDAVLVVNYKRNGIDGYIGASVLMELAIAHYFGKKIFLMEKAPDFSKHRWAHEVAIMQPQVISGNLDLI
jgi:hypothetical protein